MRTGQEGAAGGRGGGGRGIDGSGGEGRGSGGGSGGLGFGFGFGLLVVGDGGIAEAEHVAERAEDAAEAVIGGDEGLRGGAAEQMVELGGADSGFEDADAEPGAIARQGRCIGVWGGVRRGGEIGTAWRVARRKRARGFAAQAADEAGEAAGGAAEAGAEADGEGAGSGIAPADQEKHPLPRSPGDAPEQGFDDQAEHRFGRGGLHAGRQAWRVGGEKGIFAGG